MCGLHRAQGDEDRGFFVEPQNQGRHVSQFRPQNLQLRFGDLDLKITATVSWFVPQNQAGYDLSVAQQNRREEDDAGHMSRSSDLFRLEASRVRVFQFASKLAEAQRQVVTWHHRGDCVELKLKMDMSM
jgi:hypothetical protein